MKPLDYLMFGCGYLGEKILYRLQETGAACGVVTRSEERAAFFRDRGAIPILGDISVHTPLDLPAAKTIVWSVGYARDSKVSKQSLYLDSLERIIQQTSPASRWIYTSSVSVYGRDDGSWVDESSPTEPSNDGGQICFAAEQILRKNRPTASILRLAGLYGPGRVLSSVEKLRQGTPLAGRGDAWLNLIHRDDAAALVTTFATGELTVPLAIGVDREPCTRQAYYSELARLLNSPPPVFTPEIPRQRGSGDLNKRCRSRFMTNAPILYPTYREGLPACELQ